MSATSTIPFWGQSWELTITYNNASGLQPEIVSTDTWEPEALRITFEVLQSTIPSPWWYADIVIYNLNTDTIRNIVLNATSVQLKAGFQVGDALSSVIWSSPILQVLLDTENVVDTRVTLHCVANPLVMDNPVSFAAGQFSSQAQFLNRMAGQIGLPPMANDQNSNTLSVFAQTQLTAKQYPRGNTMFGTMGQYLDIVSNDQRLATFRDGNKAYITEISNGTVVPPADLTYAPPNPPNTTLSSLPAGTTQSIIGTPRQTPQGIVFTVLLDPRLQVQVPIQVVQLLGVLVTQLPIQLDASSFINPLDNLVFFVGQVRHVGDSRGNDWYTEVTGYSTTFASTLLGGITAATGG